MGELKSYFVVKHGNDSSIIGFYILADCGNCALRTFYEFGFDDKEYTLYCEMSPVAEQSRILLKCQADKVLPDEKE